MPTYDYECPNGHRFELFHSMKDDSAKHCPQCDGISKRVPGGGAGLLFKGSGFYQTDYRSSSYKEGAKQEKGSSGTAAPGGSGSDSGSKPAKPAKD